MKQALVAILGILISVPAAAAGGHAVMSGHGTNIVRSMQSAAPAMRDIRVQRSTGSISQSTSTGGTTAPSEGISPPEVHGGVATPSEGISPPEARPVTK
jgi:hypothetical protein